METTELINAVTKTPNVLGQLYTDLASPSAKAVGAALGTVFEFSTSFLLPLKLLNEKFKVNFAKRMDEYSQKLHDIPEERRCEVHPQIGTPIVEKLTYTTSDEIADLFTTLLVNASDSERVDQVHPRFIGIIESLSTDEARIIKYLKGKEFVEYCDIRAQLGKNKGFITFLARQTLIQRDVEFLFPKNIQAYISNLECLGIISDQAGLSKVNEAGTDAIKAYIGYDDLKAQLVPKVYESLTVYRSFFQVTELGHMFIDACIH